MGFVQQLFSGVFLQSSASIFIVFSFCLPGQFTAPSKMADESIYYMLSRRTPCLNESELAFSASPHLTDTSLKRAAATR